MALSLSFVLVGTRGLLIWLFVLAVLIYSHRRTAFEVVIRPDKAVVFRSFLNRTILYPDEILAIESQADRGPVIIAHHTGIVRLTRAMEELPDLIRTLRGLNPSIRLRGAV